MYLQVVAFSQLFSTTETVSNGLFTGIGKPKISSIISVIFTALRIPMALALIKTIWFKWYLDKYFYIKYSKRKYSLYIIYN